jgi:serine/threonine-protein kinase
MISLKTVRGAALAVGLTTPTVASAAQFGAIAYSTATGSHGFSYGYATRGQAERAALGNCAAYAGDCQVLVYFYNACGALAVGRHLGYGYAWNVRRSAARAAALANCRVNDSGCQVVRWVCSG